MAFPSLVFKKDILDFYLYRHVSFKTLKEMDTFSAGTQFKYNMKYPVCKIATEIA